MSRRVLFLLSVAAFGIVSHLGFVTDVLGSGATEFVRRQSEAYAMIVLIIGFWELFAADGHPASLAQAEHLVSTSRLRYYAWFAFLTIAAILLTQDIGLPQSVVTLKEAFPAAIVITAYLGWSRSFLPRDALWARGAPALSGQSRVTYFAVAVVVALVGIIGFPKVLFGNSLNELAEQHAEALGAIVLVPLYFGVFARGNRRSLAIWILFVSATPFLTQLDVFPGFLDATVEWTSRMTEAFLAALMVTIYFEFVRPLQSESTSVTESSTSASSRR